MYRYSATEKSGYFVRPSRGKVERRIATRLFDQLAAWFERARQRRQLAELDDRLLRDIGLSRAEVEHELSLPFWRADHT